MNVDNGETDGQSIKIVFLPRNFPYEAKWTTSWTRQIQVCTVVLDFDFTLTLLIAWNQKEKKKNEGFFCLITKRSN